MTDAQRAAEVTWQHSGGAKYLVVDGVTVVSDGSEASSGGMRKIASIIAIIVGVGVALELDASRTTSLAALATVLIVGGAFGFVQSRRLAKEGAARPRCTGCYLLEDGMARLGIEGRYWYPLERIVRFKVERHGESLGACVYYRDVEGHETYDDLPRLRDAITVLAGWLGRARS